MLVYVDTDRQPETVGRYQIVDLPTLIFLTPDGGVLLRLENEFRDPTIERVLAGVAEARRRWDAVRADEDLWRRKAAVAPDDPEPPMRLGRLYYNLMLHAKARPHLERAVALDPEARHPDAAHARLLATYACVKTREYERARDLAREFVARWPDHVEAPRQLYYLGVAYYHLGKRDRADQAWREVGSRWPGTTWERRARESLALPAQRGAAPADEKD